MTPPKKKPIPKVPKCRHRIDVTFPTELVTKDRYSFKVGRCFECGCIVALKEGK